MDLIDKQVVLDTLESLTTEGEWGISAIAISALDDAERRIKALPTIDPERNKGRWINGKCSRCGEHAPYWPMASTYYQSNFCQHCGQEMDVVSRNDNRRV